MSTPSPGWARYSIYGITLASDFPFASRLAPGAGAEELAFTCVQEAPLADGWRQSPAVFTSPFLDESGRSIFSVYRFADCTILHSPRVGDYYVWLDQIICRPSEEGDNALLETYFLSYALPLWLEQRGIPVLHACGVSIGPGMVGFLAHSGQGKSSLAASWLQGSYTLVTDDILPFRADNADFYGLPAQPQIRLWPEQALHFLGHFEDLERVHPTSEKRRVPTGPQGFGAFCGNPQPISRFYLLERDEAAGGESEADIIISPILPRDAVIELVRHSFVPHSAEALGFQPRRLEIFARLARQVPMRRLAYPSGYQHLPAVRQAVLDDLSRS